jgi:lipoprotein-releasing system permease protein
MPENHYVTMLFWAARDIRRRPGRSVLLSVCLASLVFLMAVPLLFARALDDTWARLVHKAPDLIVRRIDAGGWAPIPVAEAVSFAGSVPGVLDPTPRLWGVAAGPEGPVTVVATPAAFPKAVVDGVSTPTVGRAIVGRLVKDAASGGPLTLVGPEKIDVEIVGTFPEQSDLATSDIVWVAENDARRLFGLMQNQASDLAIHLFHREEASAIQTDLVDVFPWPVSITDRSTSALRHHTLAMRTGGVGVLLAIPALLAMLLLIGDVVVGGRRRQSFWGLLQALGWTTGDLVRVEVVKAMMIGLPAISIGMALAYVAVFYPPLAGLSASVIADAQKLPAVILGGGGAALVMVEVAALVGIPYLAAVFLTSLRNAAGEAWNAMQEDSWN